MHNPEILSSPAASAENTGTSTPQDSAALPVLIFDACHLGVILRAVLGVEAVVGLASIYLSPDAASWLLHTAWVTSGVLPATLLWLLVTCTLKRNLHRLKPCIQYAVGILVGMLAGLYASFMLALTGSLTHIHWLANTVVGGLLAGILVGYLVLRAQGKTPAAVSAQLAALQANIRPHFLFNALNSAIALVRDEPGKAERLLEDLSDLFRAALQDPRMTVPLREEIDLAKRYLDIEQIRFGDRLQVSWDLDPDAMDVGLPPLLLQPLVENAVRHGVEPSEIGTKVTITAQKTQKKFISIRVTNTLNPSQRIGDSASNSKGHGIALANVQRRLRLLHDVQAEFSAAQKDGIFEVCISLPTL